MLIFCCFTDGRISNISRTTSTTVTTLRCCSVTTTFNLATALLWTLELSRQVTKAQRLKSAAFCDVILATPFDVILFTAVTSLLCLSKEAACHTQSAKQYAQMNTTPQLYILCEQSRCQGDLCCKLLDFHLWDMCVLYEA